MRGMYLVMARSASDKSPRIGEPVPIDGKSMFEMVSEEDLVKDYGHKAVYGPDKKTIMRAENFDITPYDYLKLFPKPDVAKIAERYGEGHPAPGSIEESQGAFPEGQEQQEEAPSSARTRRRGAAPDKEEGKANPRKRGNVFRE